MGRRLAYLIPLLLFTGLAFGWYFFAQESRNFATSPLKSISGNVPYFIKIKNCGDFTSNLTKNSSWKSVANLEQLSDLRVDINFLDSLFRQNKAAFTDLKRKEMIVVPTDSSWLYLIGIGSLSEKKNLLSMIKNFFVHRNVQLDANKYKTTDIQNYTWSESGENKNFSYSYYKGVLMMANRIGILKLAIDQTDEQKSVLDDPDFLRIKKSGTENSDFNIYLNHRTLPAYLSAYLSDSIPTSLIKRDCTSWSELDVIQKDSNWLFNGLTITDSSKSCELDIYKRQKPIPITLTSLMPVTTSFFLLQSFSHTANYYEDFERYQKIQQVPVPIEKRMTDMSKILKMNVKRYLYENWTGEAAAIGTNPNLVDLDDNSFLLLKVRKEKKDPLLLACKKWEESNGQRQGGRLPGNDANNIFRVPDEAFGKLINESGFGFVKTKWMTTGDGFILMGASPGSLRRYMSLISQKQLLVGDSIFQKNSAFQARNSSFFLWISPANSLPLMGKMLKPLFFQSLMSQLMPLAKVENFSWQWGIENNFIYNTASLSMNPQSSPGKTAFWRYQLKAKMAGEVYFVPFQPGREANTLIFQDEQHFLTAIDQDGIEKWRIPLNGPILGKISVVDLKGSGESQIAFNTVDAIHLLDGSGREIRNFPVKLKFEATNGMAVVDDDRKNDYRFIVACKDHKLYNYDKSGRVVNGKQFSLTTGLVESPILFFRNGSKDYLVFFDKSHTFILDRLGRERIKLKEEFIHSRNNFSLVKDHSGRKFLVSTDVHGKVRLIGFDGTTRFIDCGSFSSGHFFCPVEVVGDGMTSFLFADNQRIALFDFTGKKLFSTEAGFEIDQMPFLIRIGIEKLLVINSFIENRTILVRKDGSIFNNFPAEKVMFYASGSFRNQEGVIDLVGTEKDRFLLNFQIYVK